MTMGLFSSEKFREREPSIDRRHHRASLVEQHNLSGKGPGTVRELAAKGHSEGNGDADAR